MEEVNESAVRSNWSHSRYDSLEFILGSLLLIMGGALFTYNFLIGGIITVLGFYLDIRVFNKHEWQILLAQQYISKAIKDIQNTEIRLEIANEKMQLYDRKINETQTQIIKTTKNLEKSKEELEKMEKRTFSFISDTGFRSIEDRLKKVEESIGERQFHRSDGIKNRVDKIEEFLKRNFQRFW